MELLVQLRIWGLPKLRALLGSPHNEDQQILEVYFGAPSV